MMKFPPKVKNIICEYLSINDLLQCSTLSSSWYFAIGSSETFKKRVWISLNDSHAELEDLETARDYEKLKVCSENWEWNIEGFQFLSQQKWKRVAIKVRSFISADEFLNLLKQFSRSLMDLSLKMVSNVGEEDSYHTSIDFPQLESLHVEKCSSVVLQPFKNLDKLKTLKLDFIVHPPSSLKIEETLLKFITNFSSLTVLELNNSTAHDLFAIDITPFVKFQLKTLIVECPGLDIARDNVELFIRSQGKSLENLSLIYWDDASIIYDLWDFMNELKSFYQSDGTNGLDYDALDLRKTRIYYNDNMVKLHFHFTSSRIPMSWMKPLILASPFLNEIQLPEEAIEGFTHAFPPSIFDRIKFKFCFTECDDSK